MNSRIATLLAVGLFTASECMSQSGMLQFKSIAYSVKESASAAKIIVSRVGGSSGELTVNFTTVDSGGGTAVAGDDYSPTNGTLVFGPGVTSRFFLVPILNDSIHEANETVVVYLDTMFGDNNATLTILDNDPCTYAISPANFSHGPEAGTGSVELTATAGCNWTVTESADWLSIISDASGAGSSEVQYSFDANPGGSARSAAIDIGGRVFTVTQLGVFGSVAGNYNGLFHEDFVLRHESSGLLSVKVTDLGRFTAKAILGGKRYSFSGSFADDGMATNTITGPDSSVVTIFLALDLAGGSDQITGQILDGVWAASLTADRALFNKKTNLSPQAGRYTLIVRGDDEDAADQPGGDSFGTVVVDAGGNARLNLTLADGTKATQKIALSKNGMWPLYVPLYRGAGSILCWATFVDVPDESDFSGTLTWIKPALATGKYYRDGFAGQQPLLGSLYHPPTSQTDRLLDLSGGGVTFSAGNLSQSFTNAVQLSDDNKVTNLASNKLVLTISKPTGLFRGNVTVPGATRRTPFKGALFQKANRGAGFFLGTDQSGRVELAE